MTRQGAIRRRQAAQFEASAATAAYTIRARGADSVCGCPCGCCTCCTGTSVKCEFNTNVLPVELSGVMSLDEYSSMINEIDEALQATLVPLFPCIFGHFCLPFSPICYILYYASQRYQQVNGILEKYNANMRDRGYYWETAPHSNVIYGFAFLRSSSNGNNRGVIPVAVAAYGEAGMDRGNAAPYYELAVVSPAPSAPVKMEY